MHSALSLTSFATDIDQLTRIMKVVGTPDEELLVKLLSEEVGKRRFLFWH